MAAPNPDLGATTQSKLVDHAPNPEDLKEDVGRENLEAIGDLAGPAVRLYYFDPVHYIWYGSVLVACHTKLFGQQAPLLNYKTSETDPTDVVGEIILNHAEWSVVRYVPSLHNVRTKAALLTTTSHWRDKWHCTTRSSRSSHSYFDSLVFNSEGRNRLETQDNTHKEEPWYVQAQGGSFGASVGFMHSCLLQIPPAGCSGADEEHSRVLHPLCRVREDPQGCAPVLYRDTIPSGSFNLATNKQS